MQGAGTKTVRLDGHLMRGYPFPVFTLALLVGFKLLLLAALLIPPSESALGAFSSDFRVWCFGANPETGELSWAYVGTMFGELLLFGGAIYFFWREPLMDVLRHNKRATLPYVVAALVATLGGALAFVGLQATSEGNPIFPAASLRTAIPAPAFALVNQRGEPVSSDGLRGKVTVVTGIYASCGLTCPVLLAQAKNVLGELTEQELAEIRFVGITLDPTNDTPEVLAKLALAQRIELPTWTLATGDPAAVNLALDNFGIERRKDEKTGVIDHANFYALIDTEGRVAYRFSLGETQAQWMGEALRLLVREAKPTS